MKKRKEKAKFFTAVCLVIALLLCNVLKGVPNYAYAKELETILTVGEVSTSGNQNINIEGTNSIGEMIANTLENEKEEQQENNGCNIFEVIMEENIATVSFETIKDGTMVVAVYEEDGLKMLGSGTAQVLAGDIKTSITIDISDMPDYFYLRAFLVDTDSLRPICTSYDSPNYTKEMQEFLSKTVDDFEADRVLNLDNDKTNNFAVYSEETKVIEETNSGNKLISTNEETNTYIFENAEESISSLKVDDIFAYHYGENHVLIIKVADIQIDGTTVTIQGADSTLEEVFDYVKIEEEAGTGEAIVDASTCEDGVIYNGMVEEMGSDEPSINNAVADEIVEITAEAPQINGVDITESKSVALSYSFIDKKIGSDKNNVKLSGEAEFKGKVSLKLYISLSYQYLELKTDYSFKVDISVSGKATGEITLTTVGFAPIPGVLIEFTPTFVVEVSGKVEVSGTLKGTIGFSVSNDEGMKDLTSSPKFDSALKAEVTVFIGFKMEPKIALISDNIAKASLKAKVGVEIKGTMAPLQKASTSEMHTCKACVDGEISGKLDLSYEAKLLNLDKLKFEMDIIDQTIKLLDYYYSFDHEQGAWSTCPYMKYKVSITVTDKNEKPLQGVKVEAPFIMVTDGDKKIEVNEIITDENGKVSGYLSDGKYALTVSKDGYEKVTKKIVVKEKSKNVVMKISENGNDSGQGESGSTDDDDLEIVSEGMTLSLGENHSAVITENGSLYMWGANDHGQLGNNCTKNSSVPVKIMDNVKTVNLRDDCSSVITKDGSLYMWGSNYAGQLGDGSTEDSSMPMKIMDNVATISLGVGYSGAITKDGSLYMWGSNYAGQLGDGSTENSSKPVKIMDNVVMVSLGESHSGAITKDGSLYMWGSNHAGQLGDGSTESSSVPIKIMDNVVSVSLGEEYSGAITRDGSLYMWGDNDYGKLGTRNGEDSNIPIKVLDNVSYFEVNTIVNAYYGDWYNAAITEDGSLYVWSDSENGIPTKILDNVAIVSLGTEHGGAITKDGSLYMWGYIGDGKLGNGEIDDADEERRVTPVKVLNDVVEIKLGDDYSGAITKDGSLYMWGNNEYGKLGNGFNEQNYYSPTKVMDSVKLIEVQKNHVEIVIGNCETR